jgi:hypothetical protein
MLLGIPLQIAYATNDMDGACALFRDKYGVTQFYRPGPLDITNDAGEHMGIEATHAWLGTTWLEIIQPLSGAVDVYRDWLPATGFALRHHHIGFQIPDPQAWDDMSARVDKGGYRKVFSITGNIGGSRIMYIDTAKELGHYVEYLYFPDVANSTLAKMPQNIPGAASAV